MSMNAGVHGSIVAHFVRDVHVRTGLHENAETLYTAPYGGKHRRRPAKMILHV